MFYKKEEAYIQEVVTVSFNEGIVNFKIKIKGEKVEITKEVDYIDVGYVDFTNPKLANILKKAFKEANDNK